MISTRALCTNADEIGWYSASELADMALPGMPCARNRMVDLARELKWAERINQFGEALARKGFGRGAPTLYHFSLLPNAAVAELHRRGLLGADQVALSTDLEPIKVPLKAPLDDALGWDWYDRQSAAVKKEANARLVILQKIEALEASGMGVNAAMSACAVGVSVATIWNWRRLVAKIDPKDRLPALAPRRRGGGIRVDIDDDLWLVFKSDFLRPSAPTYAGCYARLEVMAKARGITLPNVKTLQRRLEAEVPKKVIKLRREGAKSLAETLPAQTRTVAGMHAMQAVNVDGHKWDVFVKFPAKNGQPERIARPITIAMQDIYSRKIVAWRTSDVESAVQTRLCFADLCKNWGIPTHVTMDNGRAFASKWITGGAKTRFRFKIRDEDPLGVLTQLGVNVHFTKPAHGQSKPIERSFRTLEEIIGKHPLCEGAYTGRHIDAKPENYASRAIDLDVFEALIDAGMRAYNAKRGRYTEMTRGGSFDETFKTSYEASEVRKASSEQLRLALLAADQIRADRKTGAVSLYGNTYYDPSLFEVAGKRVTVRFDPQDLMQSVHIYLESGEYLCEAKIEVATGFYDVASAKARAKLDAAHLKATREAARLEGLISAAELAAMMPIEAADDEHLTPKIVRPVRARSHAAPKLADQISAAPRIDRTPVIDRFVDAVGALKTEPERRFTLLDGGLSHVPKRQ